MKVLVDTCVWSLALRRKQNTDSPFVIALIELINAGQIQIIGAVRQEVLSGIKSNTQFQALKNSLAAFPDLTLSTADFELAAEYFNLLRSKGIQGSDTDFLLCAVAVNYQLTIFTFDKDFELFGQHLPITLYKIT
ncbi:MAG: PIN domain-containing protein [Methylococcaceae bacterium]